MRLFTKMLLAACCLWVVATHALGQNRDAESVDKQSTQKGRKKMPEPEQFLGQCVGKWRGTVKTWFEPGKLADESKAFGEIVSLLNGNFFRHTYEGSMQGKPRHGEETLAMNGITKKFQVCWFDDFHMSGAILISEGERFREVFAAFSARGIVTRRLERMQYGLAEFEITDPDGYVICLSQQLEDESDLPAPAT